MSKMNLKQALELCPLDQCPWRHNTPSRQWWRYGWAYGFIGRRMEDALAPVRERVYRTALAAGFDKGKLARLELDAVGTSA